MTKKLKRIDCIVTGTKVFWREDDGLHLAHAGETVSVPEGVYEREKAKLKPLNELGPGVTAGNFEHSDAMMHRADVNTRFKKPATGKSHGQKNTAAR